MSPIWSAKKRPPIRFYRTRDLRLSVTIAFVICRYTWPLLLLTASGSQELYLLPEPQIPSSTTNYLVGLLYPLHLHDCYLYTCVTIVWRFFDQKLNRKFEENYHELRQLQLVAQVNLPLLVEKSSYLSTVVEVMMLPTDSAVVQIQLAVISLLLSKSPMGVIDDGDVL